MRRRLLTVLLLCAVTTAAAGRPPVAPNASHGGEARAELTPEEEQEARAVAVRFVEEFQKTLDVSSLIGGEMFVGDLPERIRKHPPNESFSIPAREGVVEGASDEDLRRYAAAVINAYFLWWALGATDQFDKRQAGRKGDCGRETQTERLVPAEAIRLLKSDPTLGPGIAKAWGADEETGGGNEGGEVNEDDEDRDHFTSAERLMMFVSTLDEAMTVTRSHLNSLPAWQQAKRHVPYFNPQLDAGEGAAVRLEVSKLSEDFLGLSEGESLICASVLMFHLDLVGVGGSLKILHVSSDDYKIHTREEAAKAALLRKLGRAIETDDMEAFESLTLAGLDVNAKDYDCTPPLVYAALHRRLAMVKALIAMGADVNAGNKFGNPPLIYAAVEGDEEIIRALLDAGADVNARAEGAPTALYIASRQPSSESHRRVVRLLESRGAVPE